jgi:purine-binding chemotaxis protein CheW
LTARSPGEQNIHSPRVQWVVFACGGHRVAIPIHQICEVVAPRPLTRVPGCGPPVCGLINLRGQIITVLDFGAVLGLRPAAALPEHRLLLLEYGERLVAFAVDNVIATAQVPTSQLSNREDAFRALNLERPELLGVGTIGGHAFLAVDPMPILRRLLPDAAGRQTGTLAADVLPPFRGGNGTQGSDLR